MTRLTEQAKTTSGSATGAMLLLAAVGVLALPSAVLAFSSGFDSPAESTQAIDGGFKPAQVDPRLARSITVRALSKDRTYRFTPAATPSRPDGAVTVAVRLDSRALASFAIQRGSAVAPAQQQPGGLGIAPTAYSLGAARGYRSFANNTVQGPAIRQMEMPDLASYQPKQNAVPGKPSRFAPRVELDEKQKAGRSPRTFEQSDQTVGVGGSYRVSRNLNLTAGVRVTSDNDRLLPLTDGKKDNQAVYVGTQFKF
jgi:hypothetical protein